MPQPSNELVQAVYDQATARGVDPAQLLAVMGYETGGTYNPDIWGGTGGNYMGLIQFGPEERSTYGVHEGMPVGDQVTSALNFLHDRGFDPTQHGLMDMYSTINAGSPGHNGASDRPGQTVRSHTAQIESRYLPTAREMLAALTKQSATPDWMPGYLAAMRGQTAPTAARPAAAAVARLTAGAPAQAGKPNGGNGFLNGLMGYANNALGAAGNAIANAPQLPSWASSLGQSIGLAGTTPHTSPGGTNYVTGTSQPSVGILGPYGGGLDVAGYQTGGGDTYSWTTGAAAPNSGYGGLDSHEYGLANATPYSAPSGGLLGDVTVSGLLSGLFG